MGVRSRAGGGAVARRAVIRWAGRLARREWREHALVTGLLTVAVAAAVAVSAAVSALAPAAELAAFGAASHRFTVDDADPAVIEATIDAAEAWFPTVEVIRRGQISVEGRGDLVEVRVQDPEAPLGAPMLGLRQGRFPTSRRELAVAGPLARELGVAVGSELRIDNGATMRVVGVVENPHSLADTFVVAGPQFADGAPSVTLLVDTDHDRGASFRGTGDPIPLGSSRAGAAGPALVAVLAAAEVALVLVSLIAAAGFAVSAQRRQRQLGMLAAIGATEQNLRLVTLSGGALVGGAAALTGTVIGLSAWFVTAPEIGRRAGSRVGRFDAPWWIVALIVASTLGTTTAAAWWPARVVARVPIVAALAGRRPRPQPARRSLATAVVFLIGGLVALAAAGDITSPQRNGIAVPSALAVATGTVAIVIGVLSSSPAVIRLAGARVDAFPLPTRIALPARIALPTRIALRDLARYQARSAAALGAISLALGIPLAVTVGAASAQHGPTSGNLSSRQLVVSAGLITSSVLPPRSDTELEAFGAAVDQIAARLGGAAVVELRAVIDPRLEVSPLGVEAVRVDHPDREGAGDGPPVFVASDALLDALALRPAPGFELVTAETGPIGYGAVVDPATGRHPPQPVTNATIIERRAYTSLPSSLLNPRTVTQRGWKTMTTGWLIETPDPLADDQLAAVRPIALGAGLRMEARQRQAGLVQLGHGATVVGMVLALGILALTVGLLRSEAAADVATLTATGVTSGVRRAITASTAAALAGLAVLMATTAVFAALAAATTHRPAVPTANLAVIGLGVPLLAGLAGYAAAGRHPGSLGGRAVG